MEKRAMPHRITINIEEIEKSQLDNHKLNKC